MNKHIMMAMSGGVDSAVAAFLAQKMGQTAGVTMYLAGKEDSPHAQNARADIEDAKATCEALKIPHYVADLSDAFYQRVINAFVSDYEKGLTPNPCIDCNKHIKFGALFEFAKEMGYSHLATGHYARIKKDENGRALLYRAKDLTKDQSYMLWSLSQDVLSRTLFPLGEYTKSEVRQMAAELGFSVAHKSDSQDICFVPDGEYAALVKRLSAAPIKQGHFISPDDQILGTHKGIIHYTVGQGKGLGISLGKKAFVLSKSAKDNTVTLGDDEALYSTRLTIRDANFIPFDTLTSPLRLTAKARYRQEPAPARIEQTGEREYVVEFDTPQRAIAPGQSLVLYDGDLVVGGGKII